MAKSQKTNRDHAKKTTRPMGSIAHPLAFGLAQEGMDIHRLIIYEGI